jgi:threonine dehydratase
VDYNHGYNTIEYNPVISDMSGWKKTLNQSSQLSLATIREARQRIADHVLKTPLVPCEKLSQQLSLELAFKAENLQHIGAFKARGATNAVLSLSEREASGGVVTHSSGNHAAALARAAQLRKIPAYIVMPGNSAKVKIENVRNYGVQPHFCEASAPARAAAAQALQEQTGAAMIHPYDDYRVIAGQGTMGLEILEQWAEVEVVFAPVGGGGLLAGLLIALKSLKPQIEVIAVEPELADDAFRSLRTGKIEQPIRYDSVADGLRTCLGELTFPIIQRLVDEIVLVSDSEILKATTMIGSKAHLLAEPSGAVALAGLIKTQQRFQGKRCCVIVSGGNADNN